MNKIKVSEEFFSLQGEGFHVGTPSLFLRVFGCNKTCSGFSMPLGEKSQERFKINPANYTSYNELPLVHTGCDSYASWMPEFKQFSPVLEINTIVDRMVGLLPDGKFNRDKHLILTGGEPLLGFQKAYIELFDEIYSRNMNLSQLTFETNGTQFLNDKLLDYLCAANRFSNSLTTTFSVSAKLPCSGETWETSILPDRILQYQYVTGSIVYLKFVVGTNEDLNDVHRAVDEYRNAGFNGIVYLMPVGGTVESYTLTETKIAELAKEYGYRFSPRLQIPLWKNAWAT